METNLEEIYWNRSKETIMETNLEENWLKQEQRRQYREKMSKGNGNDNDGEGEGLATMEWWEVWRQWSKKKIVLGLGLFVSLRFRSPYISLLSCISIYSWYFRFHTTLLEKFLGSKKVGEIERRRGGRTMNSIIIYIVFLNIKKRIFCIL